MYGYSAPSAIEEAERGNLILGGCEVYIGGGQPDRFCKDCEHEWCVENFLSEDITKCQTAHCGRYIPHFDFGAKPSPIVPYRHLPQTLSGMTADCRSLV